MQLVANMMTRLHVETRTIAPYTYPLPAGNERSTEARLWVGMGCASMHLPNCMQCNVIWSHQRIVVPVTVILFVWALKFMRMLKAQGWKKKKIAVKAVKQNIGASMHLRRLNVFMHHSCSFCIASAAIHDSIWILPPHSLLGSRRGIIQPYTFQKNINWIPILERFSKFL